MFFLDTQSNGNVNEQKRRDIVEEMEEIKARQLEVSDKLAIYIRSAWIQGKATTRKKSAYSSNTLLINKILVATNNVKWMQLVL